MEIPTSEPQALQAGDTLRWRISLPDFPASDGWALAYRLVNGAGSIAITATPDGDAHTVLVDATTSAAWPAGSYTAVRTVTRAGERHTLAPITLTVRPDYASATSADARTPARRALDDLRAALAQWLATSGAVQDYQIAGRSMRFATVDEIQKRITLAERQVAAEAAALGERAPSTPRRVLVRF